MHFRVLAALQLLLPFVYAKYLLILLLVRPVMTRNFTVYRLFTTSKTQLDFLHDQYLHNVKLDFWKEPSGLSSQVHVMVERGNAPVLLTELTKRNITYETMIEDVEKLIKQRKHTPHKRHRHWLRDAPRDRINFNLAQYHSFAEVINYLNALALTYPDRVQVMPIGTTHEGRQIPLIKIGTQSRTQKPAMWLDGGIHAREWIAPALVTEYESNAQIRRFVDQLDWYMAPLLNPDGYEFSRSSIDPEIRLWRKNRSPKVCTQTQANIFSPVQTVCCSGVDLNRNFDWHFGITGSSTDPCSEIYQGAFAFSEPETRSVRDFVSSRGNSIKAFLTFHSYSQILMYPYGHQLRTYSTDVADLRSTALQASHALRSLYGTNYVIGTGADTLYPASGGSEDWAKGKVGVKLSYLFELRPEEHVWDGFLLNENQILPTCRETWEAVKVIAVQTMNNNNLSARSSTVRRDEVTECVDRDALCKYWAENGACHAWPSMRERCALSCGFCSDP